MINSFQCFNGMFKGLVVWTKKDRKLDWTRLIRTGLAVAVATDRLQSVATDRLQSVATDRLQSVATDRLQSVATGFRYSSKIRTFWAYFEENQARNTHVTAKTICYGEIQLCMTSRSCIFWVLDNFYYHKNYIGSYYTLYSIFHSCFYIQKY